MIDDLIDIVYPGRYCAWCGKSLQDINEDEETKTQIVTHGICVGCTIDLELFPNDNLKDLSRQEIDNLPYGTIILDKNDRVIWYNKKEENITGFSATKVEGKLFFTQVAPCTSVKEFKGKLDDMKQTGVSDFEVFDFTFTHPTFKALVKIAMQYLPEQETTILQIKRTESN